MSKTNELIEALNQVAKEKGIDKELIFEAIETSLISACKKHFGSSQNVRVDMNRATGAVKVFSQRIVVTEVTDIHNQIKLEDARKLNPNYELMDCVETEVTPRDFGRISAQTAKQVVVQKFREAERDILFNEYITKEKEVVTGIIQRSEKKNIIVALGKIDAVLPANEQIQGETYRFNERKKFYVTEVKRSSKGPVINLSRTHPELVKKLLEQEVPEINDGIVEIRSVAREAGSRTKIAVHSKDKDIDPIGSCVGHNGHRINVVVKELGGEKIDVISWSDDPKSYIVSALSPAQVLAIKISGERSAKVLVPDNQLSLVIGKEGQNVRLAAKLTGFKIDIRSESAGEDFVEPEDYLQPPKQNNRNNYADEDYQDEDYTDDDYDDEYDDDGYDEYDDEYDDEDEA